MEPAGWGTHYAGQYITEHLDDVITDKSDLTAGNTLPAKALLQAAVREYATVDRNRMTVEFTIGSLSEIRNSDFDLDTVLSHLSVADVVPSPDGPYVGDDKANDYAIFARVTGVTAIYSERGLRRRLDQFLTQWLASAQGIYERLYDSDSDPAISQVDLQQAAKSLQNWEQLSEPAIKRFDRDIAIADESPDDADNEELAVVCGLYRRTNSDTPNP
jgi:hypothetical protein